MFEWTTWTLHGQYSFLSNPSHSGNSNSLNNGYLNIVSVSIEYDYISVCRICCHYLQNYLHQKSVRLEVLTSILVDSSCRTFFSQHKTPTNWVVSVYIHFSASAEECRRQFRKKKQHPTVVLLKISKCYLLFFSWLKTLFYSHSCCIYIFLIQKNH